MIHKFAPGLLYGLMRLCRKYGAQRWGGMVRKVLLGMGKGSSALADITEDTKLTKEEFGELIAKIDKGLRSLPATAQVRLALLLAPLSLSPGAFCVCRTSHVETRGNVCLQGAGLGSTKCRKRWRRRRRRPAALCLPGGQPGEGILRANWTILQHAVPFSLSRCPLLGAWVPCSHHRSPHASSLSLRPTEELGLFLSLSYYTRAHTHTYTWPSTSQFRWAQLPYAPFWSKGGAMRIILSVSFN
jgi:hypothetical protein